MESANRKNRKDQKDQVSADQKCIDLELVEYYEMQKLLENYARLGDDFKLALQLVYAPESEKCIVKRSCFLKPKDKASQRDPMIRKMYAKWSMQNRTLVKYWQKKDAALKTNLESSKNQNKQTHNNNNEFKSTSLKTLEQFNKNYQYKLDAKFKVNIVDETLECLNLLVKTEIENYEYYRVARYIITMLKTCNCFCEFKSKQWLLFSQSKLSQLRCFFSELVLQDFFTSQDFNKELLMFTTKILDYNPVGNYFTGQQIQVYEKLFRLISVQELNEIYEKKTLYI